MNFTYLLLNSLNLVIFMLPVNNTLGANYTTLTLKTLIHDFVFVMVLAINATVFNIRLILFFRIFDFILRLFFNFLQLRRSIYGVLSTDASAICLTDILLLIIANYMIFFVTHLIPNLFRV